jgi:hypothetical protein
MDAPETADYRAYVLDSQDHIVSRYEFEAKDSTSALEIARQWVNGHDVEIWQRTHIIGRLKSDE